MQVVYISNGLVGTPLNYRGFKPQHNGAIIKSNELVSEVSFESEELFCYFNLNGAVAKTSMKRAGQKIKFGMKVIKGDSKDLPIITNINEVRKKVEGLFLKVEKNALFNKRNAVKLFHGVQKERIQK